MLLVFGSYTCPNFRGAADTLNKLYPEYKDRLPFYLIYIREAHSTTDWASTRNQREGIVLPPAANMHERQDHATMCVRKLHIEFPTLLDSMEWIGGKGLCGVAQQGLPDRQAGKDPLQHGFGRARLPSRRTGSSAAQGLDQNRQGITLGPWGPVTRMRKFFFAILLGLSSALLAQTAPSPQELVNDAIAKQRAGDLAGAVKEYREF